MPKLLRHTENLTPPRQEALDRFGQLLVRTRLVSVQPAAAEHHRASEG
jgi:hypothetical protein